MASLIPRSTAAPTAHCGRDATRCRLHRYGEEAGPNVFRSMRRRIALLGGKPRGAIAFDVAQHRRLAAIADGRIARADLYQAICTVLGDRDRVFTRLKRPER